jgi:hypothetical protein
VALRPNGNRVEMPACSNPEAQALSDAVNTTDLVLLVIVIGVLPAALVFYVVVGILPPWIFSLRHRLGVSMLDVLIMRAQSVNAMAVVQILNHARELGVKELSADDIAQVDKAGANLRPLEERIRDARAAGQTVDVLARLREHDPTSQPPGKKPADTSKPSEQPPEAEQ